MVKRTTSAGLAVFITTGIALLLLAPATPAMPASGLDFQETDTTPAPSNTILGETAQSEVLAVETSQPQGAPPVAVSADRGSVMFVENVGQWDAGARFQVWGGPAGTIWLADDAIWITLLEPGETSRFEPLAEEPEDGWSEPERKPFPDDRINSSPDLGVNIKLSFVGANPQPCIESFDRLDTVVSYFLGNDPELWRPEVPVWGGVRYVDLYPGVDLEFTGENGRMTPRLAARRGADQSAVGLRVEGADVVEADGGFLRLSMSAGEVAWPLLAVNEIDSSRTQVEVAEGQSFEVSTPFVPATTQQLATNDFQRSPTDNPADLLYATFLGGTANDYGNAIALDGSGSAYVTGYTASSDFPTTPGAFDPSYNGGGDDAFVAKLNPANGGLAYVTFLGGDNNEFGNGIAVSETGNAYVTGSSKSNNFPTTPGTFDMSFNGDNDAFVVKLNPAGSGLTYATFLGGSTGDFGKAIALDGSGNAYITGFTQATSNFPTTPGSFDPSHNGGNDAFVAKLNSAGSGLVYGTFLGGASYDYGNAIAVDETGSAYLTGRTTSSNFPVTPNAFDPSYHGGNSDDAFVVKLNAFGSGLVYGTFLGGASYDYGNAIAVDEAGSVYVTGETLSFNFPTTLGALDPSYNGGDCGYYACSDAFVAKLNSTGSGLVYATFLGGNGGSDSSYAVAVDAAGNAYVTGNTQSANFPTTASAFDSSHNGGECGSSLCPDAFVAKLNPAGSGLAYATFLGGTSSDHGDAIAVGRAGGVYVTGETLSTWFPRALGTFDPDNSSSNTSAYVVKLAMAMFPKGYLPLIIHHSLPLPSAPVLYSITQPNDNPSYIVRWTTSTSATSFVLQRATSASFADATEVYAGTDTTTNIASQGIARYYYRVKARNQWGDSPWSNVQSVEVRWEQEPNYPYTNANGPLLSGLDYYGYPNDNNDYFFFQVASRGQVVIDLSNHTGIGVQLVLRTVTGDQVAVDNQAPYHLVATVDPGRYYIQIYTESGLNSTTPYTLQAVFP